MKRVTILGCGPSGLLAAHAFAIEGWEVVILSKKQPSLIGGAQYLHSKIPHLTDSTPEGVAHYIKIGTRDGYAEKVYGNTSQPVSWDLYDEGPVDIWSLRKIYAKLWEMFEPFIHNTVIDQKMVHQLSMFGLVVSSIPGNLLCDAGHTFNYQQVFVHQENSNVATLPENFIEYNGSPEHLHYRHSKIFGVQGWEFTTPSAAEIPGIVRIKKPISTNCKCLPHVVRVGRYGRWEKSQLAHHAFEQARELARAL